MTAQELLQQGQLAAATEAVVQTVKSKPGDVPARIFLFELLAAAGAFDRAAKHLEVVAEKAPAMLEGIASYRGVLAAEQARAQLFERGVGAPQRLTAQPLDPEPSLSALRCLLTGAVDEAERLTSAARAKAAAVPGVADGVAFDDIRDADDLLCPYLEVIAQGLYGWIPFEQITKLEFSEIRFLRDTLWRPANITLTDGLSATMFVPVRYPSSAAHADEAVRLGRSTAWVGTPGLSRGVGQRAYVLGEEVRYILELGTIELNAAGSP